MRSTDTIVRMRFILIHLLWHTVHFDGVVFVWICYCRTVLLCSVTVVRTFQLCGHRKFKPDISSWLFYHSLWTILCYVSRSLWNLLFCPFIHSFCFLTSVDLDELHCLVHVRRGFYRWIILLRSTLLIIVKYF